MADEKLIFPIGFDLEEGVSKVEKDWGKMQKRLQDTFKSQTIQVDADISKAVLDKLYAKFEGLIKTMESKAPQIKLKMPDTVDFEQEINRLKVQLKNINSGELTDAESKDLYLYIRQLEALAKALKEVNKQEQLRQANNPANKALQEARAQEKLTRAKANDALAEQRRAKIATETARQNEINNRSAQRGAVIAEQKRAATARAEQAELRLTQAKERSTAATERQNSAYKTQSTYLGRLVQRMIAYVSVAQVLQFWRNVREVTAEFELQRVALGSIIGDLNTANTMFEQIKAAAVKSPFQIKELVSYTKQLAAYKIETDELFETTQKLADVSAGLGVGMERLVLAYGQIRATGYLRASEVRQLTEAGIPIIEELAKKMSQLRGETVSAAEVMGMISERAISFGMVKEVFDDMTSAGGMFYKMQEKQAETLAGQISNLKDSFAIMYDEIGRSENVNSTMKSMIGLVKSLAENWRDVWSVVQSLSVAMGVYYVTMKNAAVASTALTASEARLAALEMTREARMPRLIALMLGQNKAITVTIAMNKALVFAQKKALMATTALGKAFWKLTTAMLSNPYTAVLAALAGITFAIVKFSTKTKTTQERIDDLNKSVASLNELANPKNGIKKLIDEFDELSRKANKTEKEQKRLNQVTRALAESYPSAINGVKEYGQEVGVAADKVKELYQSELKLRQDRIRQELKSSEEEYAKLEALYNDYISRINKGTYLQPVVNPNTDEVTYYEKAYTEEQLAALGNKALEIADKMRPLATTIKNAKIALGELNDEGANAVDTFNTWQKELASITEGKNLKGEGIRVFDDESITQINKLTDATARVAEEYDKLAKEKKEVDKALLSEGAKADKDTYAKLQERLGKINDGMSGLYDFLKKYGALDLIKSDDKTKKSAEQALKDELAAVEKIYKRYQDLRKLKSESDTQSILAKEFKGVSLTTLSKAYSPKQMIAVYQKAQAEAQRLGKKDLVLEIQTKIGEFNVAEKQRELEKNLKKLSDDFSRTKTAKEFFDRMLGLTGDKQLSATLTMSVYGTTGDDLKSALVKQVQGAFAGQDLSKAINTDLNSIDLSALREIYNNLPEDFQEKQKASMKQVIDMLEKQQQDISSSFAKLLMGYDEMEQKRVTITDKATRDIATLEQGLQAQIKAIREDNTITDKDSAIKEAEARAKAVRRSIIAKQALDLKKLTPEYLRFFSSINSMSIETANTTRTALRRALFDAFEKGAISAEELRKELKAIDTQFKKLNENNSIFGSYMVGGFDSMFANLQENADELDAIAARMKNLKSIDEMGDNEKSFVNRMLNLFGGKGQKNLSDLAKSFNGDMSKMGDAVADVGGKMQGMLSGAMGAISIVDMIIKSVHQSIEAIQQVLDQINSMRSEDNQVGGWFKYISDFDKYAMSGWERLKSGDVMGAMADTVSSIISIFQNIQEDKIEKINDRIEEQQKLLENLEYSYSRLEKEQEKVFGSDYVSNYEQRMANLQSQQNAYLAQAQAERDKGKKADSNKIKEYEDQARATADAIKDMQGELAEHFLGTDMASAARDFANAWIDAYKEFGSTADAMTEKFSDMIENMIVESFAAKVIQSALQPIFDNIDAMSKDGVLDIAEAVRIAELTNVAVGNIDVGMNNLMSALQAAGISVRGMGGDLTGISRDIASASEESILGLATGINTQNYYISQVPAKMDIIIGLLQGGNLAQGSAITLQDLVTLQNQHLSYLPTIAQHTADTVAECKRTADACENMMGQLRSVIKPNGTQSAYKLNATLSQS